MVTFGGTEKGRRGLSFFLPSSFICFLQVISLIPSFGVFSDFLLLLLFHISNFINEPFSPFCCICICPFISLYTFSFHPFLNYLLSILFHIYILTFYFLPNHSSVDLPSLLFYFIRAFFTPFCFAFFLCVSAFISTFLSLYLSVHPFHFSFLFFLLSSLPTPSRHSLSLFLYTFLIITTSHGA